MSARPIPPPLPEGVTIRRATLDDAPTLARMRARMFEAMGVAEEASPQMEARFAGYLERAMPAGEFLARIAFADGEAIGSAAALITAGPPYVPAPDGRVARLLNVFVDEAWRGRAIARALIIEVLDDCEADGIRRVGLVATEQGRPVYEALGFEPAAEMRLSLDGWLKE